MKELIIFPGALGDLVCFFPTLRELIRRADGNAVELMARDELARFAVNRMGIARAHSIDRAAVGELFVENAHRQAAAFFDFARVHCWFAAHNPQFRRNLERLAREVTFYPFRPAAEGHVAVAYLNQLGVETSELPEVSLQLSAEDQARADRILAELGLEAGKFLLILPGSGSRSKNWPAVNFGAVGESLGKLCEEIRRTASRRSFDTDSVRSSRTRLLASREHALRWRRLGSPAQDDGKDVRETCLGFKPLVVLGPAEAELAELFRRNFPTVGGLELGTVAALARLARGFIGNDSGVSHLAAASGARGLVLFGPSDPARWRPLGAVEIIRRQPLDTLTVDEVRECLFRLIGTGPRSPTVRRRE